MGNQDKDDLKTVHSLLKYLLAIANTYGVTTLSISHTKNVLNVKLSFGLRQLR